MAPPRPGGDILEVKRAGEAMYRIDRASNQLETLKRTTFAELGFSERKHLQEWIANDPSVLGEELLIIQKEFAGFNDTNERLDLLALDKQGNLIIIENKLDDSGRDVTWQALKYASYCASLGKNEIRNIFHDYLERSGSPDQAEARLSEFFDDQDYADLELNQGNTQRIILVAAAFRKEVTSTVLWLLNYRLRVQCFRVTPFTLKEQVLLNFEQIIPLHEAEEYMISMAEKAQETLDSQVDQARRRKRRMEFWSQFLDAVSARSSVFQNVNPRDMNQLDTGAGVTAIWFMVIATNSACRAQLWFGRSDSIENKWLFDQLLEQRSTIEGRFGGSLVWDRMDGRKSARISVEGPGDFSDEENWPAMIEFLSDRISRLADAVTEPLLAAGKRLRHFTPAGEEEPIDQPVQIESA